MRWKTTVVLLIVTVAVGVYVSQVDLKRPTRQRQLDLQRQVVQIAGDQITSLAVQFPEAPVTLTKTGEQWRLTAPLSARADETLVRRILSALDPLMAQGALEHTSNEPLTLTEFGLEPPAGTLKMTTAAHTVELQFGAQTAIGQSYYAKRGDAATVFIIGSELPDALKQSLEFYRSHDLLDLNTQDITTITAASAPATYTLTKTDQAWQLTAPVNDAADGATISTLLSRLRGLRIERFISDSPQPTQLTEWGVDAPIPFAKLTMGVSDANRQPLELIIGNATTGDATHRYAKRSDEGTVYSVTEASVQEFLKDPQELRSRTILDVFANEVTKVRLAGPHGSWTLEFADGTWTAAEQPGALDTTKVEEFLWRVRDTKLTSFVDEHPKDLKAYGLEPAQATIEVWVTSAADSKRLSIGHTLPDATSRYGLIAGRAAVVELPESITGILHTTPAAFTPSAPPTATPPSTPAPASANQ